MKISFVDAEIKTICLHIVGNKLADENCIFSKKEIVIDSELNTLLSSYFLSSFKSEENYKFYHETNLSLNEVYTYVTDVFNKPDSIQNQSINLAKHLYNQSTHPNIKGGEFYVVHFQNITLESKSVEAIGIFKSENKDIFLEVEQLSDGFDIESKEGININKLDKGCLIFNANSEDGYIVSIVDNTNKGSDAQYWKDHFLGVQVLNNEFQQTSQFLGITKQFVTKQLTEEFEVSKTNQIELLNRSVDYFKKHDNFDRKEFEEEVLGDTNVIKSFRKFDNEYRTENEIEIEDNFEISNQAVKKQARVFKSVLKLDKNFHIYIHGNSDLIEQGVDENGRKFYKIYYKEES